MIAEFGRRKGESGVSSGQPVEVLDSVDPNYFIVRTNIMGPALRIKGGWYGRVASMTCMIPDDEEEEERTQTNKDLGTERFAKIQPITRLVLPADPKSGESSAVYQQQPLKSRQLHNQRDIHGGILVPSAWHVERSNRTPYTDVSTFFRNPHIILTFPHTSSYYRDMTTEFAFNVPRNSKSRSRPHSALDIPPFGDAQFSSIPKQLRTSQPPPVKTKISLRFTPHVIKGTNERLYPKLFILRLGKYKVRVVIDHRLQSNDLHLSPLSA